MPPPDPPPRYLTRTQLAERRALRRRDLRRRRVAAAAIVAVGARALPRAGAVLRGALSGPEVSEAGARGVETRVPDRRPHRASRLPRAPESGGPGVRALRHGDGPRARGCAGAKAVPAAVRLVQRVDALD